MKTTKKILVLLVAIALFSSIFAMAGCDALGGKTKIGVAMPTKSLQRWNQDGSNMEAKLKEAGYDVDLQYANDDPALQISQIENMITNGCKVLVIASIDGSALGNVLKTAKDKKIKVIAYDRLLMNTDACDYYATFDNYMVGTIQGQYIETALGLKDAGDKVFNMEMFAGSPDDNNARFFFQGAYDVLKPYIDAGTLNLVSGLSAFEDIAIPGWKTESAQAKMDDRLSAFYSDRTKLDVVLSPNDSLALGIANSLTAAGFEVGVDFPIITGQDCDKANMKNVLAGKQSMSIFKDTRDLADKVVEMVKAIIEGKEVPVNDTKTYDNGVKVVPSFLCVPKYADKNNYKELLIDSGYYTEADLA